MAGPKTTKATRPTDPEWVVENQRVAEENERGHVAHRSDRDEKPDTVGTSEEMERLDPPADPTGHDRVTERDDRAAAQHRRMSKGTTDARPHGQASKAIVDPPADAKAGLQQGHLVTHGADIRAVPNPKGEGGNLTPREQMVEDRKAAHAKRKAKVLEEREEILRKQGAVG
jgi:hypothetical protein